MRSRLAAAVAFALAIFLFDPGSSAQQPAVAIPSELLATIAREGRASYLVVLRDRADVSGASVVADRNARGRFVYDELVDTAARSQAPLVAALETEIAAGRAQAVRRFISVNALGVTSTEASLRRLAALPQVEQIIPVGPASFPRRCQAITGEPRYSEHRMERGRSSCSRRVGRGLHGPGHRCREHRYRRSVRPLCACRPVPWEPWRQCHGPQPQLVGRDQHLLDDSVRRQRARHTHCGHDGRRRRRCESHWRGPRSDVDCVQSA